MSSHDKARFAAGFAAEKKGQDIVLINIRGLSSVCDWFVLVSASSGRRINAISRAVDEGLSKKGFHPIRVEGRHNPNWVLMDYGDVVVHIFYTETREFYGLERLWSDAPREEFDEPCLKKSSRKKSRR